MARFPLSLPRGIFRNGTRFQSKGRWYDANLVRWYGSALGNIRGWRRKGTDTLTGAPRAALAWRANNTAAWLAVGTHSHLYVANRLGTTSDVTPVGFTSGRADAVSSGGYGTGPYGKSSYGTARPDSSAIVLDATQWTLDFWGEDLVGVSPDDRKIYKWTAGATGTPAAQISGSPNCDAVVATDDRFLFALGTDLGTDDPRAFSWCNQEDDTNWTPGPTNQAGSYTLKTPGKLMCGRVVKGGTLLLTTADAWIIQYIGGQFVHSRDRVGEIAGVISRQGVAVFDQKAIWLSPDLNFWVWNGGAVVPLECEVLDYIRRDINMVQATKVVMTVNAAHFEVEVRYCSASSTEIDRCVIWQFKDDYWNIGRASRTCGVDRSGTFTYPILISSDGKLYDHEIGWDYDDIEVYATTGPIELGNGDNTMTVLGMYPDDAVVGDVTASFVARRNADDVDVEYGPYTLTQKTDFEFNAGQIQATFTAAVMADWRVGVPKLELVQAEARG